MGQLFREGSGSFQLRSSFCYIVEGNGSNLELFALLSFPLTLERETFVRLNVDGPAHLLQFLDKNRVHLFENGIDMGSLLVRRFRYGRRKVLHGSDRYLQKLQSKSLGHGFRGWHLVHSGRDVLFPWIFPEQCWPRINCFVNSSSRRVDQLFKTLTFSLRMSSLVKEAGLSIARWGSNLWRVWFLYMSMEGTRFIIVATVLQLLAVLRKVIWNIVDIVSVPDVFQRSGWRNGGKKMDWIISFPR